MWQASTPPLSTLSAIPSCPCRPQPQVGLLYLGCSVPPFPFAEVQFQVTHTGLQKQSTQEKALRACYFLPFHLLFHYSICSLPAQTTFTSTIQIHMQIHSTEFISGYPPTTLLSSLLMEAVDQLLSGSPLGLSGSSKPH